MNEVSVAACSASWASIRLCPISVDAAYLETLIARTVEEISCMTVADHYIHCIYESVITLWSYNPSLKEKIGEFLSHLVQSVHISFLQREMLVQCMIRLCDNSCVFLVYFQMFFREIASQERNISFAHVPFLQIWVMNLKGLTID